MAHRIRRDRETIAKARSILASPYMVGSEVWVFTDDEVTREAEFHMNTLGGSFAALRLSARRLGQQAMVETRLGHALGYTPGEDNELEQLMECAER